MIFSARDLNQPFIFKSNSVCRSQPIRSQCQTLRFSLKKNFWKLQLLQETFCKRHIIERRTESSILNENSNDDDNDRKPFNEMIRQLRSRYTNSRDQGLEEKGQIRMNGAAQMRLSRPESASDTREGQGNVPVLGCRRGFQVLIKTAFQMSIARTV